MPTPVVTAKDCLTPEAAQTLDDAVVVARCRAHAQTTSLHVVSALLSLSSSALREACAQTQNNAYSGRIQFKALGLCLGVAMDRIPATRKRGEEEEEPPVSNSLMAAVKRAQASQRRMPESFHLYQQQSSSVSMVKVELQNLVLSILDDPVVSRVFGEAGFRSCDIKFAILKPLHQLLRYSRYRGPPMFLCNLIDDNFRRIENVLMKPKGRRNPFLIGSRADDALHSFCDTVEKNKGGYLFSMEVYGFDVIRMGSDVFKFESEKYNETMVKIRFKEVALMVEQCNGAGVIICYGDVKEFTGDDTTVSVSSCVLSELTKLFDLYGAKVCLIGAAATYETFLKFLNIFYSIVKDWDLQLLHITSPRSSLAKVHTKYSHMESFVPFPGFFSTSSDLRRPFVGSNQCPSQCHLCSKKCERETHAISKQVSFAPAAEQFNSSLPSWLQINDRSTNKHLEVLKATDEGLILSDNVQVMQPKLDNICQLLHHNPQLTHQSSSQVPLITSNNVISIDMIKTTSNSFSTRTNGSSSISDCRNITSQPNNLLPRMSSELGQIFVSQMKGKSLESHELDLNRFGSRAFNIVDGKSSQLSATSVAADLGLKSHFSSAKSGNQCTNQPLLCCRPASVSGFDIGDSKTLYAMLSEKISWQEEAVSAISQAVSRCKTKNPKRCGTSTRGDTWYTFIGPDSFSKKKIAVALVEILYGSKGNFIGVDLKGYDVKSRGKNVVDHVAWELSRKPFSVVFLENIDEADLMVQNSLSQALRTGKFPDSHGREVSINNTILVATSMFCNSDGFCYSFEDSSNFSQEYISRAKRCPLQMVISCSNDSVVSNTNRTIAYPPKVSKRKSIGINELAKRAHKEPKLHLDLNFPPEETELHEIQSEFVDNPKVWFDDFIDLVDESVVFKPFDFQKFSEKVMKEIDRCFYTVFDPDCQLEVGKTAMEQILVATYQSENSEVTEWIKEVLKRGFVETQRKYSLIGPYIVKLATREDSEPGTLPFS